MEMKAKIDVMSELMLPSLTGSLTGTMLVMRTVLGK